MPRSSSRNHPSHERAAANPFWVTLFERLERVVQLQLEFCPYSDVHRHESMVSGFYEPLKQMYEHLSHGVSFESIDVIAQRQLNTALLAWLRNEAPKYDFDPERVTHGGLNEWKGPHTISVSGGYPSSRIATLVWAAIGRAAAGGQNEPPNAGMSNDIRVLTLLPYCDAMFVDNGCRGLWEKVPGRYRPAHRARLFSYNTREQFLAYLEEVEAQGEPAVLACAREVYGEPEPFLTM